jgi:hypothetical protein
MYWIRQLRQPRQSNSPYLANKPRMYSVVAATVASALAEAAAGGWSGVASTLPSRGLFRAVVQSSTLSCFADCQIEVFRSRTGGS